MEVIGLSETLAAIQQELNKKAQQAKVAVKLAGNEYKTDVQKIAPLGHMPGLAHGDYRRSIHVQMIYENGQAYALVGTNKIQAKQLEFGGVIRAKNAPYLVFKTEDGNWVQTKEVFQPGHPHFRPALDLNRNKYLQIMKGTFDRDNPPIETLGGD